MPTIIELDVVDVRFPTSRSLDGSDAMNPDPDYSAAYVVLRTDAGDGHEGHGLTFTIGRGTEVVVAAVGALEPPVTGRSVEALAATRADRGRELLATGYPAYTTSVGWLGYDDDKIRRLCREALAEGWTRFKMKVGADRADDVRRARMIRTEIGPDRMLAVDANQRWDVPVAISWMRDLAPFDPYWIEEPTSPDDILG